MPDLGKYAFTVLASYGVTIGLLGMLIAGSLWTSKRTKTKLKELEQDER